MYYCNTALLYSSRRSWMYSLSDTVSLTGSGKMNSFAYHALIGGSSLACLHELRAMMAIIIRSIFFIIIVLYRILDSESAHLQVPHPV